MNYRNLFPWLVFVFGLLILKLIIYLPLLNAVVSVSFAIGAADMLVYLVAPECHDNLNSFVKGTITEYGPTATSHTKAGYTYHAAIGAVLWFVLFVAILVTRYAV